jgi:hypothetical protein
MKTPEWLKPGLYGAVAGAVGLAIAGFSWGGWVTGGTARSMAADQAQTEVVAVLAKICLEQSKRDPRLAEKLAQVKLLPAYERSDAVMKTGWATMPGEADPNRQVARGCLEQLASQ